jgi:hypothetical protein
MYPFWNPYYQPFMVPMSSWLPIIQPQMIPNPTQFIAPIQNILNDQPSLLEVTKNIEKNTEQPSKSII